jgi:hypothetical protein
MGTTDPKHSHGGLTAAFAQHPFKNIRGNKKMGRCVMHTPNYELYYPKWDHRTRGRRMLPNLLNGVSAYD